MKASERRGLSALRLDWCQAPDDVWDLPAFHVPGLHADTLDLVRAALVESTTSAQAHPLGLVITGVAGAGKTHLLGAVRQRAQDAEEGYFFLLSLGHGETFWESTVLSMLDGLQRPAPAAGSQLKSFLRRLGLAAGVPVALHPAIVGEAPLGPEDLNQFVAEIRRLNRAVGQDCRDTARALVLFGSENPAQQDIGYDYLLSMNEIEPGQRAAWGMQPGAKPAQRVVRELSQLLALTGSTVLAIDQIDTVLTRDSSLGAADTPVDRAAALQINLIADGLMSLREVTRRTVCVLSCTPQSWELIRGVAVSTVPDRFRTTTPLNRIPTAELGRDIVAKRFAVHYAKAGFRPDYPTWPIRPEAFEESVDYTPRSLLQVVDAHVHACLQDNEVRELRSFGGARERTPMPQQAVSTDELLKLAARFDGLRRGANVGGALDPDHEDRTVPALLAAGLAAWIEEANAPGFVYDAPPGARPALHARLRRALDESTGDETHWAFRAIGHSNAVAALNRLRSACVMAGVSEGLPKRRLFILRNHAWSNGAKTREILAAVRAAGGDSLTVDLDDLRVFAALRQLREDADPLLPAWLADRRPAGNTTLFRTALATALDVPPAPRFDPRPKRQPGPGEGQEQGPEDNGAMVPRVPKTPRPTGGHAITLGTATEDGEPVTVELEALRKHAAIFAGSGSGKTVLIRRLVEECALRGVSAIVLDPNNDLARLGDPWPESPAGWGPDDAGRAREYLEHTDVVVWTPRREAGRPLSFQPLPDFRSVLDDADEFRSAVDSAVATLAPRARVDANNNRADLGQAVLREALSQFARTGGSDLKSFLEYLADLPDGVSALDRATKLAADMSQTLRAAMVNDPLFGGDGAPVDPGRLLTPPLGKRARVSVISFVGLPSDDQRQSFVNQLQMALFAWVKQNPAGDRPLGGLLVMDEAQTLAPSGAMTACTQSTLALASQARKYGLGLVFATQAPKGLHNRIPGNAATQLFGLLNAPVQIDAAKEMARAKGSHIDDIARLRTGQFYAAADGQPFAKLQAPLCLTHHPKSPLTTEEVIARAKGDGAVPRPREFEEVIHSPL